jgi:microcystin-dependent protein
MRFFFTVFLTALFAIAPAVAQVRDVTPGSITPGFFSTKNYIKNPSCLANKNDITDASSIVTRLTTGGLVDGKSCQIDASAGSQVVKFTMKTFDNSTKGKNCEARLDYSGDGSLYQAYVEEGGSNIQVSGLVTLQNVSTDSRTVSLGFPCGDPANAKRLVVASTGNGAAIQAALGYAGIATNLASASQTTDWQAYTPIISSISGTITNYTARGFWRRVGDTGQYRVQIEFTGAVGTWSTPTISLPSGQVIDTAKIPGGSIANFAPYANARLQDVSPGNSYHSTVRPSSTTTFVLQYPSTQTFTGTAPLLPAAVAQNAPFTWASGDFIEIELNDVPIVGFTASNIIAPEEVLDFTGAVFYVGSSTCPAGSLDADGAAISRTANARLFAKIGTTFGVGDGSTTFNKPDLRGIFVRGVGSQTFGSETYTGTLGTKQNDNLQSHTHNIPDTGGTMSNGSLGTKFWRGLTTTQEGGAYATTSAGSGTETYPANIGMRPCIATGRIQTSILVGSATSSDAITQSRAEIINTIKAVAADYTALFTDETIEVDTSAAARTITLPALASAKGKKFEIVPTSDTNRVIIDGSGSETICGQTTISLFGTHDKVTLQAGTSGWTLADGQCIRTVSAVFAGATRTSACSSTPCVLYQNKGNWVTSVTRSGGGKYDINVATGVFATGSEPECVFTTATANNRAAYLDAVPTPTLIDLATQNAAGSDTDAGMSFKCSGPR